ncbi:hypothetical protein [Haliea sp.]|jgi:hypothetical protein|uniref:hypothetical protein n=1 Tax=Haliea TaxID=475794 RepID=UPI000C38239C|nr:hypothetical protein [Haliea sp.]HAN68407.1 hypothetical protein [Halieaceae bacterium]MAD63060.1 hypothetical protein [Haliea sp.]MAY91547.1 hypothetical protein [Haliea sp.]MBK40530.1 hypothetical protein [Haliea sp.]MBP68629.1 hypothetical protein [Haliea sp.]|tara:strand:- start:1408 stop:1716 length:309 start_codon:yes stop_codon:yes gene_type:complete
MKLLLTIPTLLLAANTWASCPASLPVELPAVPDGVSASYADMQAAQEAVAVYVAGVEAYLDCRTLIHPLLHNRLVDRAETVAATYNGALENFRKREDMLATY